MDERDVDERVRNDVDERDADEGDAESRVEMYTREIRD